MLATAAKKSARTRKSKAKVTEPEPMVEVDSEVAVSSPLALLLNDAQQTHANTEALLKQFFKLERKGGVGFIQELISFVQQILIVFKKEPAIERLIAFISLAVIEYDKELERSEEDENLRDVAQALVLHLSAVTNAKDKAVRYRSCQFLRTILNFCQQNQVESFMFDELQDSILVRAMDKTPVVRIEALAILSYLQEDGEDMGWEDLENPITMVFLRLATTDSSSEVRKAALTHLGLSKNNLHGLLMRTRDIKDTVRVEAFRMLSDKCNYKSLSKDERVSVLTEGLNDRSANVREACVAMVTDSWLSKDGNNPIVFLRRFNVIKNEATAELMLQRLFEYKPATRAFTLTGLAIDDLAPEPALFWSALCSYYHNNLSSENSECLEAVSPTLCELTEAVKKYVAIEMQLLADSRDEDAAIIVFITKKLLSIAALCDVGDEVGRRSLSQLARDMLTSASTSDDLLSVLVDCIAHAHPETNDRLALVTEIIAGLADDENYGNQTTTDISMILDTDDDISDFTPEDRQYRSLMLCALFLEKSRRLTIRHGAVVGLIDNLILPGIQNMNALIREKAIRSLGLCCLIDPHFGRTYLLLLLQVAENDVPRLQVEAVKTLFDLLLVFGPMTLGVSPTLTGQNEAEKNVDIAKSLTKLTLAEQDATNRANNTNTSSSDVVLDGNSESQLEVNLHLDATDKNVPQQIKTYIPVLYALLQSDNSELRTIAAEGFAKLLHTNHLASPTVFSALVVLYYNPMSNADMRLRQCLGVFFPEFAFSSTPRVMSGVALTHQDIIAQSFLLTLNTILDAPRRSPLHDVNAHTVGQYLLYLTNPSQIAANAVGPNTMSTTTSYDAHDSLIVSIVNECFKSISTGENSDLKMWLRFLCNVEVNPENQDLVKAMRFVLTELGRVCNDRIAIKLVEKVSLRMAEYDKTPDEWLTRNDLDGMFESVLKNLQPSLLDGADAIHTGIAQSVAATKRRLRTRTAVHMVEKSDSEEEESSDESDDE
eukprot:CFRG1657T1